MGYHIGYKAYLLSPGSRYRSAIGGALGPSTGCVTNKFSNLNSLGGRLGGKLVFTSKLVDIDATSVE